MQHVGTYAYLHAINTARCEIDHSQNATSAAKSSASSQSVPLTKLLSVSGAQACT